MPSTCAVPGCRGNYTNGGPRVSTFKFPKDETQRQKWILAIRRKDFTVTEYSRVCELHFKESDFETEISAFDPKTGKTLTAPLSIKRLKKGVIPTLQVNSKKASKSVTSRETPEQKRIRLEKEQLSIAMQESLKSVSGKTSPVEKTYEAGFQSNSTVDRLTEDGGAKSDKKKGVKRKSKLVNEELANGISDSNVVQQSDFIASSSSDFSNYSENSLQNTNKKVKQNNMDASPNEISSIQIPGTSENFRIKEEKPWEEEYNYLGNSSTNFDMVKIQSVQSVSVSQGGSPGSPQKIAESSVELVSSNGNVEKEAPKNKPSESCDTTFYKKPLKIDERDGAFGKFVACEMSDLRANPELYLKTQQSILKLLVEAHFEQMSSSNES